MEEPSGPLYRDWSAQIESARPVPRDVAKEARPLSENYARQLWRWLLCTKQDVIPLLEKTCWVWRVRDSQPFSEPGQSPRDNDPLPVRMPWADDERVFFLGRADQGYETTWRIFRTRWGVFLNWTFEDGILFHPLDREALVFFEGWGWLGRRSARRLTR